MLKVAILRAVRTISSCSMRVKVGCIQPHTRRYQRLTAVSFPTDRATRITGPGAWLRISRVKSPNIQRSSSLRWIKPTITISFLVIRETMPCPASLAGTTVRRTRSLPGHSASVFSIYAKPLKLRTVTTLCVHRFDAGFHLVS